MPPTRLILPAVLAAALLVPASAGAKELTAATVCGAAGCTTSHDAATLRGLSEGGPLAPAPRSRAPFYTVRLTVKVEGASDSHWTVAWVPSAKLMRSRDTNGYSWLTTTPAGDRAIARITRGLKPFAAGKLRLVLAQPRTDQGGGAISPPAPAPRAPAAVADTSGGFRWGIAALLAAIGAGAAGSALWRLRRRWAGAPHAPAAG